MRSFPFSSFRLHSMLVRAAQVEESYTDDDRPTFRRILVAQPLLGVRVLQLMMPPGFGEMEKTAQPGVAVLLVRIFNIALSFAGLLHCQNSLTSFRRKL